MTQSSIPNLDEENIVSTTAKTALGSLIGADRAGVVCDREFDKVRRCLFSFILISVGNETSDLVFILVYISFSRYISIQHTKFTF